MVFCQVLFRTPSIAPVVSLSKNVYPHCVDTELILSQSLRTALRDICLKLPFRSQLIHLLKTIFKELHAYIMINSFNEGICVEF